MGEKAISTYNYKEYLDVEANSDQKFEFHDGFITAMAGGSPEHSQIAVNFINASSNSLDENKKSCIVYNSDLKISIESTRRTYYPDASIVCEKPDRSDKDNNAITNPILILEVLSESTQGADRGYKFTHYRQIPSLREYVLVSQEEAMVDTFYKTADGTWEINSMIGLGDTVILKSLGIEISMKSIYRRVEGIDTI